jgi:two-component system NtrC family response regulator
VGPTRTTALLLGETGTGKERLAQALHDASPRRNAPFVAVNCAALTESVLESELFGHEKGAFTGAYTRREGRFKAADGGTIFLDEIGEITPAIQVKLLRVLQERKFERVGGNETVSVDVRIVAATNRNLREMVEAKLFRADLYYRLNVVVFEVPPLRARKEDIPALVDHILPRLALELGLEAPALTPEALRILAAYDWPGNVRELENVLERALVLSRGRAISELVLSRELLPGQTGERFADRGPPVPGATFAEIERHAIITTYEACGRSPQKTAAILGLSPRTIHYRLREYGGKRGRRLRPLAEIGKAELCSAGEGTAASDESENDGADCTPCATVLHEVH